MNEQIPDWVKVKVAAIIGVSTPLTTVFLEKAEPIVDFAIKVGQLGVAVATIIYILAKWRKVRNERRKR